MPQQSKLPPCRFQFPDPELVDPDGIGIIAMGADLSASTLVSAYTQGLFPWFNEDEPITWWCPEPRCVIAPQEYTPSKSLQRQARKSRWQWSVNHAFSDVIHACSLPRSYENDTWIHTQMIEAYTHLHTLGYAHSIEVWECLGSNDNNNKQLTGGLYGIKIGKIFFGESMFHTQSNASKIAFWALTNLCQHTQIELIDCQLPNDHLLSLGAKIMPRSEFLNKHRHLVQQPTADWQAAAHSIKAVCQLCS